MVYIIHSNPNVSHLSSKGNLFTSQTWVIYINLMIVMRYVVCITTSGEKHTMILQTMMFINYSHATCNINYVLIYIDRVYEKLFLKLECRKINSVSGISWLVMAFFSSSNYLEDEPYILIIMYEQTVVAKLYLNHELVHV